jgi:hypothetical protein
VSDGGAFEEEAEEVVQHHPPPPLLVTTTMAAAAWFPPSFECFFFVWEKNDLLCFLLGEAREWLKTIKFGS